jgi:putative phage-type endonuclease
MKVLDFRQGSEEWLVARAGKVTASRMGDVIAKIKSGEAAARRDYRAQIVAEILTGQPQESTYMNDEMRWGLEYEPIAASAYELHIGEMVDAVGLVQHPTIERAAASPDRLVGAEGVLEIKCPKTATHLQYLLDDRVPPTYEPQMAFQLACTGRAWCDFVSYDPRLPERMRLFVKRLSRDEARIAALEADVRAFLLEVDRMLGTLAVFTGRRLELTGQA